MYRMGKTHDLALSKQQLKSETAPTEMEVSRNSPYQRIFQEAVRNGDTCELRRILEERLGKGVNINLPDPEGQTALHQSCIDGNLELVKMLVKFGADVRLTNRFGFSPIHVAAYGGHQHIALFLLNVRKR